MMANMIGDWKLVPELTTGHDEFAKALGMTDAEREATRNLVYTLHLSRDGEVWHMKVDLEDGSVYLDVKFTLGVPFSYLGVNETAYTTSVITLQDDRFIQKMTTDKGDVVLQVDVDMYRDGEFFVSAQTKDDKTTTHWLRKL